MRTINIDMDNVVADFERHYLGLTGTSWDSADVPIERWEKLAGKEELFFLSMPAFNGSQEFVQEVNQLGLVAGYQCQFLTALPSLWDFRTAADEKTQWVVEKIGSELPVVIGPFAKNKVNHCKPKDILIDDSSLNIQQWNAAGGYGILHVSFQQSISELKSLLSNLV